MTQSKPHLGSLAAFCFLQLILSENLVGSWARLRVFFAAQLSLCERDSLSAFIFTLAEREGASEFGPFQVLPGAVLSC